MTQRESRLSRKILTALREERVFCFKIHGGPNMMAGLPDLVACVDGRFVGLETKHEETRDNLSERQKYVGKEIWSSGGHCYVVCSVEEALSIVRLIRAAAEG